MVRRRSDVDALGRGVISGVGVGLSGIKSWDVGRVGYGGEGLVVCIKLRLMMVMGLI